MAQAFRKVFRGKFGPAAILVVTAAAHANQAPPELWIVDGRMKSILRFDLP